MYHLHRGRRPFHHLLRFCTSCDYDLPIWSRPLKSLSSSRSAPQPFLIINVQIWNTTGDPDSIATRARQLLAEGVDILGPGCGLSRDTPLANIQALTRTIKPGG
jgi:uroporphyrinogen-III decarboxylase